MEHRNHLDFPVHSSSRLDSISLAVAGFISSRHLLALLPLQPSLPQGTHCRSSWITVWIPNVWIPFLPGYGAPARPPLSLLLSILSQGPQLNAPLGPKRATTGVPTDAAICMGAESTPKKRTAISDNAASCLIVVAPQRSTSPWWGPTMDRMPLVFSISCRMGDDVTATLRPLSRSHLIISAIERSSQHLKSHRDVGCTCTICPFFCSSAPRIFLIWILSSSGI